MNRTPSATFVLAAVLLAGAPVATASAKTCKAEPTTAKSSSRIAGDEAKRDERAKDNAIKRWSRDVQALHGVAYKFWFRADEPKVECGRSAKSSHCTVTAKPCRLL